MKRESYVKRLVTSYKNLSKNEKEMFRYELNLFEDNPKNEQEDAE